MSKITVEGYNTFEVAADTRLVTALEQNGVDILHRCGGQARCTTCRVEVLEGEPQMMTKAEHDKLVERDLLGKVRLSCQILCDHDMTVRALMTLKESGLPDPGSAPEAQMTPEPEWITR